MNGYEKSYPEHDEYRDRLLVNMNGKALWKDKYDKEIDNYRKQEDISPAFERLVKKLAKEDEVFAGVRFYQFRGTVADMIYRNPKYRGLEDIFLGHAPQTTAKKHYIDPEHPSVLNKCLTWLESEIFDEK